MAILLPIDLAEQLRRIGPDQGLGPVVELAILNLPGKLYEMIPLFVGCWRRFCLFSGPVAHLGAGGRPRIRAVRAALGRGAGGGGAAVRGGWRSGY